MIKKIFVFLTLIVLMAISSIRIVNSLELESNGNFLINHFNNQNNEPIYSCVVLSTIKNSEDVKSLNASAIKLLSATQPQARQTVVEKKIDERFYVAIVLLVLLFVILLWIIIHSWNSRKFTEWNESNDCEQ